MEDEMDRALETTISKLLASENDMTIATVREDGYPQATTVSYVSDGLKIYFGCDAGSQKARNIARSNKVSLAIDAPYASWEEIKGLSIGGTAERVTEKQELNRVVRLMHAKFPQINEYATDADAGLAVFRITPQVISVLDYTKGFGHTELVTL
jgi:nitroimidazol reductase NimA-like FMN-containing flavoprotein (pyridoxamine 5'-phosphate oxidase superfamily)